MIENSSWRCSAEEEVIGRRGRGRGGGGGVEAGLRLKREDQKVGCLNGLFADGTFLPVFCQFCLETKKGPWKKQVFHYSSTQLTRFFEKRLRICSFCVYCLKCVLLLLIIYSQLSAIYFLDFRPIAFNRDLRTCDITSNLLCEVFAIFKLLENCLL